jgi:WD40 repeat protein
LAPTEVSNGFSDATRLSVSRDEEHVAVASGRKVSLLETREFRAVKTFEPPSGVGACAQITFSPDGKFVTSLWETPGDGSSPGEESLVQVWSVKGSSEPELSRKVPRPLAVRASAVHPEGNRLVTAELLGQPTFWSLGPRNVSDWPIQDLITLKTSGVINGLQFSPDGSVLVATRPGSVSLWRAAPRRPASR